MCIVRIINDWCPGETCDSLKSVWPCSTMSTVYESNMSLVTWPLQPAACKNKSRASEDLMNGLSGSVAAILAETSRANR